MTSRRSKNFWNFHVYMIREHTHIHKNPQIRRNSVESEKWKKKLAKKNRKNAKKKIVFFEVNELSARLSLYTNIRPCHRTADHISCLVRYIFWVSWAAHESLVPKSSNYKKNLKLFPFFFTINRTEVTNTHNNSLTFFSYFSFFLFQIFLTIFFLNFETSMHEVSMRFVTLAVTFAQDCEIS